MANYGSPAPVDPSHDGTLRIISATSMSPINRSRGFGALRRVPLLSFAVPPTTSSSRSTPRTIVWPLLDSLPFALSARPTVASPRSTQCSSLPSFMTAKLNDAASLFTPRTEQKNRGSLGDRRRRARPTPKCWCLSQTALVRPCDRRRSNETRRRLSGRRKPRPRLIVASSTHSDPR